MAAPRQTESPLNTVCSIASMAVGGALALFFLYKLMAGTTLPLPLVLMIIVTGATNVGLGLGMMARKRAAWAFSVALHVVAAIVCTLGAPAIARAGLHPLGAAVPPLYTIAMVVLLAATEHDW